MPLHRRPRQPTAFRARLDFERPDEVPQPGVYRLEATIAGDGVPGDWYVDDNISVMAHLAADGVCVQAVYADPPFGLATPRSRRQRREGASPQDPSRFDLEPAYGDDLAGDDFLAFIWPRLRLLHGLLLPTGLLYLHLDWRSVHYARVLCDEVFGSGALLNEIIWCYHGPNPLLSAFKRKHDTLLLYARSDTYRFEADAVRVPYDPVTRRTFASPRAGFGRTPDLDRGKVPEDWWYLPVVARLHSERAGYETQKPLALVERCLLAATLEGDRVLDPFAGAGTTAVAAARHARRWICIDRSEASLQVALARFERDGVAARVWRPATGG